MRGKLPERIPHSHAESAIVHAHHFHFCGSGSLVFGDALLDAEFLVGLVLGGAADESDILFRVRINVNHAVAFGAHLHFVGV